MARWVAIRPEIGWSLLCRENVSVIGVCNNIIPWRVNGDFVIRIVRLCTLQRQINRALISFFFISILLSTDLVQFIVSRLFTTTLIQFLSTKHKKIESSKHSNEKIILRWVAIHPMFVCFLSAYIFFNFKRILPKFVISL
jgi:hypothetical protein